MANLKQMFSLGYALKRLFVDMGDGTYGERIVAVNADGSSIGGGQQYTEGDVDATISGTAILWENTGNALATVAAATPLPTNMVSGTATITGGLPPLTGAIYDAAGNQLTPKFALDNVAASQTDHQIIAAVSSHKIRVHQVIALADAITALTFQSNATPKSPLLKNNANGGEVLPFSPMGWFETVSGEALKVTTGSGGTTGILVGYTEVP